MENSKLKVSQTLFIPEAIDQVWDFITSDQKMMLWFGQIISLLTVSMGVKFIF